MGHLMRSRAHTAGLKSRSSKAIGYMTLAWRPGQASVRRSGSPLAVQRAPDRAVPVMTAPCCVAAALQVQVGPSPGRGGGGLWDSGVTYDLAGLLPRTGRGPAAAGGGCHARRLDTRVIEIPA